MEFTDKIKVGEKEIVKYETKSSENEKIKTLSVINIPYESTAEGPEMKTISKKIMNLPDEIRNKITSFSIDTTARLTRTNIAQIKLYE